MLPGHFNMFCLLTVLVTGHPVGLEAAQQLHVAVNLLLLEDLGLCETLLEIMQSNPVIEAPQLRQVRVHPP